MKNVLIVLLGSLASGFALAQTASGFEPLKNTFIDPNRAFISPFEFTQAFGGVFEARTSGTLFWEYNGVQLLLKKNSTAVSSLLDQKTFELVRPVQVKDNRTVVEATIVFRFNCTISPTSESEITVAVTCGAGQTLQTAMLKRY